MNMVEATLEHRNGKVFAHAGSVAIGLDDETIASHPALKDHDGRTIVLGIRPEDLEDAALAPDVPGERRISGTVELTEALGSEIMVHFSIEARQAVTEDVRELAQDVGDERAVRQLAEGAPESAALVGRFGARSRVRPGDTIDVAVDTRSLHFFDPETGLGIYDGKTSKGGVA
jgi:multiple sugar transport system ATP-binding protein